MLRDQLFKGSKTRSVFCFFLKRQLLPLEMDYAAGWFCLSLCMQPGSLRLSFAKRRTIWVILWQSWSSIWWAIFHCPLKRHDPKIQSDWIIWMNICCQVCSESFVSVRPFRRGVAVHLQSVSLLCLTLAGWTKWGVYLIISVKGLLVFFCNHMKPLKMSPIIQPV